MLLELKNIKKYYRLEKKERFYALDGIDIGFEKGEFVSIIGPSGCGKSTLLNIIAGMDTPSEGDLIIEGKSTRTYKEKNWDFYRRNNIGYIFQNFNLIEHLTALENVEIVMNLIGLSKKERIRRSKELLKKVGIEKFQDHRPSELSGGQKQRVAIARALANDPDIILADEPTGALDRKTGFQIMELLKEIAHDKLIIMVTHNPRLAKDYSSRIVSMLDGKIVGTEIINESNEIDKKATLKKKKSKLPYIETLKLSLRNLKKKKSRVIITALAGSIGVIGIALVLGLGNGANIYIDEQINKFAASNILTVNKELDGGNGDIYRTSNIDDFKSLQDNEQYVSIRPAIGLISNVTVYYQDHDLSTSFQGIADKDHRQHLEGNYRGTLPDPTKNQIMINEALADTIIQLQGKDVDTTPYADLLGEKVTFKLFEGRLAQPLEYEFTISAISSELNIMMSYIYFDYEQMSTFLSGIDARFIYPGKTALDVMIDSTNFEITIRDAQENLNVADWIRAEENGGRGQRGMRGDGEVRTGYGTQSLPSTFKSAISQLIMIAQLVMIAFISVSFVVSAILTAIVLFSSVLERKVEIGVLKAVGCRNKDVIRVFESEAILTGFFSGVIGVVVAFIAQPIANQFISNEFGIDQLVRIPLLKVPFTNIIVPLASIIILIGMSILVSAVAGYLPSRKATKMQVIDALRDE